MAIELDRLSPDLFTTMVSEDATQEDREAAARQIALWAERVYEAVNELQSESR